MLLHLWFQPVGSMDATGPTLSQSWTSVHIIWIVKNESVEE
jgi:hypothetical protein